MTKEEYVKISQFENIDKMPMIFFFYKLQGGKLKDYNKFNILFKLWLSNLLFPIPLSDIISFVTMKLNKHFDV